MSSFEYSPLRQPKGWAQFAAIDTNFGQALAKDVSMARIFGLQYRIESVPLFKGDTKYLRHHVMIDGWEYSILNESTEYPVLSFSLLDKFDEGLPQENFITDIRSYSSLIPHSKRSANRAVSAALFMIDQITGGNVPDTGRVLRSFKIHPAQSFLYKTDLPVSLDLQKAFEDRVQISARAG
jgi:hypothetical protein